MVTGDLNAAGQRGGTIVEDCISSCVAEEQDAQRGRAGAAEGQTSALHDDHVCASQRMSVLLRPFGRFSSVRFWNIMLSQSARRRRGS